MKQFIPSKFMESSHFIVRVHKSPIFPDLTLRLMWDAMEHLNGYVGISKSIKSFDLIFENIRQADIAKLYVERVYKYECEVYRVQA